MLNQFSIRRSISMTSTDQTIGADGMTRYQRDQHQHDVATDALELLARNNGMDQNTASQFANWQSGANRYGMPQRLQYYTNNPERMMTDWQEELQFRQQLNNQLNNQNQSNPKPKSKHKA